MNPQTPTPPVEPATDPNKLAPVEPPMAEAEGVETVGSLAAEPVPSIAPTPAEVAAPAQDASASVTENPAASVITGAPAKPQTVGGSSKTGVIIVCAVIIFAALAALAYYAYSKTK